MPPKTNNGRSEGNRKVILDLQPRWFYNNVIIPAWFPFSNLFSSFSYAGVI